MPANKFSAQTKELILSELQIYAKTNNLTAFYDQLTIPEVIKIELKRGALVSRALMIAHFEPEICALIRAGEQYDLALALGLARERYTQEIQLKNTLVQKLIYPIIVLCLSVLMLIGFMIFIVPSVKDLLPTSVAPSRWPLLCLVLVFVLLIGVFIKHIWPQWRRLYWRYILCVSLAMIVRLQGDIISFLRSLQSGLPLPIAQVVFYYQRGVSLPESLARMNCIEDRELVRLRYADQQGQLANMLETIAQEIRMQLLSRVEIVLVCIEPALLLGVGVCLGCLAYSLLGPLLSAAQAF